jgi:hypothetical protein
VCHSEQPQHWFNIVVSAQRFYAPDAVASQIEASSGTLCPIFGTIDVSFAPFE